MSEIGSGDPTNWPTAQDTNTIKESGATQATSNFANDVADRIIKLMNILGNDPHGGPSGAVDVAARIGAEHTFPGAHTTAAPVNVTKAAASAGTGTTVSRADHKHDVTTAIPSTTGTANSEGTNVSLARSDHVHDGRVGDSKITDVKLAKLQRTEVSSRNNGTVTVLSTATDLTNIDLGTVNSGDRILVSCSVVGSKGSTAGRFNFDILKESGTSTILFNADEITVDQSHSNVPITGTVALSLFTICKVTGTGTLVLKTRGLSAGSDTSVSIGGAQLYGLVLNNG